MKPETIKLFTVVVGTLEVNCYILADMTTKRAVVIDPGAEAKKIQAVLDKNGLTVAMIINTHGHGDHISANGAFTVPIYIHRDDADMLTDPAKNMSLYYGIPVTSPAATTLLTGGERLTVDGIVLEVLHTPGHTHGCICLTTGTMVFTGDTLFRESIGRTDFPNSDSHAIMRSIKNALVPLGDRLPIYPGHGPSSTIGWEKKHNFFLSRM